jgi:hypothetical protein
MTLAYIADLAAQSIAGRIRKNSRGPRRRIQWMSLAVLVAGSYLVHRTRAGGER